nr:MAG TPA: hypothetical protein [Caudoviricetes sp.]
MVHQNILVAVSLLLYNDGERMVFTNEKSRIFG